MENGEEDIFQFSKLEHLSDVASLELWRESKRQDDAWFCEYVTVSHMRCDKNDAAAATPPPSVTYAFPCHQWIKLSKRYELFVNNSMLPQLETLPRRIQHRREHLYEAKNEYRYEAELTGYPRRVSSFLFLLGDFFFYLLLEGKLKCSYSEVLFSSLFLHFFHFHFYFLAFFYNLFHFLNFLQ